jgi:hypothetical protein
MSIYIKLSFCPVFLKYILFQYKTEFFVIGIIMSWSFCWTKSLTEFRWPGGWRGVREPLPLVEWAEPGRLDGGGGRARHTGPRHQGARQDYQATFLSFKFKGDYLRTVLRIRIPNRIRIGSGFSGVPGSASISGSRRSTNIEKS